MRVQVIAPFPLDGSGRSKEVVLPDGASLLGLLRQVRAPLYAYLMPVSVNGEVVPKTRPRRLQDGDVVIFIAPLGGG